MKPWTRIVRTTLLLALLTFLAVTPAFASNLVITIDPGHGGSEKGATAVYNKKTVLEKNLNLSIAKALRDELNTYENVTVYMTRSTDKTVPLTTRANLARQHKSDLFISIHNNARGGTQNYTSGSCVLVSSGQYYADLAKCETALATQILTELHSGPGTTSRGLLKRLSSSSRYPNGTRADYYSIIRNGTIKGMTSILVEHAFVDNKSDYTKFLNTAAKLKALGVADATAIAKYYGLTKKNGSASYSASGNRVRMISKHWMLKNGKYYYVKDNGSYKTGWFKSGKYTYHLNKSGAAATGLHTYTGSRAGTYYFTTRGRMVTGWKKVSGKWYYFRSTGKAWTNTSRKINGKTYKFDSKGVCTNK